MNILGIFHSYSDPSVALISDDKIDPLIDFMGKKPRLPDEEISQWHMNLAYEVQKQLEEVVINMLKYWTEKTRRFLYESKKYLKNDARIFLGINMFCINLKKMMQVIGEYDYKIHDIISMRFNTSKVFVLGK